MPHGSWSSKEGNSIPVWSGGIINEPVVEITEFSKGKQEALSLAGMA